MIVKLKHRKGNICQLPIQVTDCIDLNVEGLRVVCIPLFVGNLNADKTRYMIMSRGQNAGRSYSMKIDNSSIERGKSSNIWEQC